MNYLSVRMNLREVPLAANVRLHTLEARKAAHDLDWAAKLLPAYLLFEPLSVCYVVHACACHTSVVSYIYTGL
jgi:hypothetical protein